MRNPNLFMLDGAKKKKFIEKVSYLGIEKIPNTLLIQTGRERIVGFSGSLSREEISDLGRLLSVEGIGLYFAKDTEDGFRMSLDALHLLKEQIKENTIELSKEQEREWFLGKNIQLTEDQIEKYKKIKGFVSIFGEGDIIGTGKMSQDGKVISNFLPKERRIRS